MQTRRKVNEKPYVIEELPEHNGDIWSHVEHKGTAEVLDVIASDVHQGVLVYTVLLTDKMNLKQPMAFDMQVTDDGIRLLSIAQALLSPSGVLKIKKRYVQLIRTRLKRKNRERLKAKGAWGVHSPQASLLIRTQNMMYAY